MKPIIGTNNLLSSEKKKLRWSYDFQAVLNAVERNWWASDWGFKHRGRRVELHTGGWSDNEGLIHWLETTWFWFMSWQKTTRGGHYYFIMPRNWETMKGDMKHGQGNY